MRKPSLIRSVRHYSRLSKAPETITGKEAASDYLKHEEKIVEEFLQQKDVPLWHRGVSQFQTMAAIKLHNALRDDTEQRTSHRVRACMSQIGLDPLIDGKQTRFLMRLSRGNDMAFLWFLMELHYKTPTFTYSLNEQLIMSSIAHLDMITTLRELDRLLPPGHPPAAEIERKKRLELRRRKLQARRAKELKERRYFAKQHQMLPYFKPLPRPRHYGKSLYIQMPHFQVSFPSYVQYKNPRHIVNNESNRWYSQYNLSPSKRIVSRIINDELANLFDDFSAATEKGETLKPMCGHHKDILALEESLKDKLLVIARERCLKVLDVDTKKKEIIRTRIMDQLEQEIGRYVCKFHKIARESQRQCRVQILPNECTGYDFRLVAGNNDENVDDDEHTSDESCAPPRPAGLEHHDSNDVDRDFRRESGGNIFMSSEKNKRVCPQKSEPCKTGLCTGVDQQAAEKGNDIETSSSSIDAKLNDSPAKGQVCISNEAPRVCNPKSIQNYNYGHSEASTPTESQMFFEAPSNNKPYQFDYPKIFRFKSMIKRLNVRKAFVSALNNESGKSKDKLMDRPSQLSENNSQPEPKETARGSPDMIDAISKCVCRVWKNQVAVKNIELEAEEERIRNLPETLNKSPLNYEEKLYNPDDQTLMLQMLKDAMEYLSQNPKFVLASMPDSYKLPLLKLWIAQRYGKVYSRKERFRSYHNSVRIFRALDKLEVAVKLPTTRELGANLKITYSCHDYLIRKAKNIQKDYYKRLNAVFMEQTRIFWFAMSPYFCSGGPPRNTYYAYMPAHIMSVKRFRIWKTEEFMKAKTEWEKRMRLKYLKSVVH